METKEINRDIKRMVGKIKTGILDPYSQRAKDEFQRLYRADITLKSLNADSLRALIVLNRIYEYEHYKSFGIRVEL